MLHPLNKLENPLQGFSKCFTIYHFKAGCSEVYREMRLNVTFFAYLIKKKRFEFDFLYCDILLGYAFAKRVSMLFFIPFGRFKLAEL